jgi:CheY-like chemotaxis protein
MGDGARLAQIAGNLLHNAIKFTSPGGRISVRLRADAERGRAELEVADTGIGMDPLTLQHLFEPFAQADRTLDRSRGGLGLGLALVRGLVELQGGSVAAASEGPDRGSIFTVWLPLAEPLADQPSLPSDHIQPAQGLALRALVIDDRRDAIFAVRKLLELGGHAVRAVHDGPAGLAAAAEFRPHLVLCDIGLPEMNGYEVARRLRAAPELDGLYLVAVTGYGQEEARHQALAAGFDDHMVKPIGVHELSRVVSAAAARHSPPSAVH